MSNILKEESVKEMLNMLKGDYSFPVKLWVWGKVVKEWAGIIIGSAIFFLIALFIVLSIIRGESDVKSQPMEMIQIQSIEEKEKAENEDVLKAHLKEIAEFMQANSESVTNRQKITEALSQEIILYAETTLNQTQLENKLESFSSLLSRCNKYRGMYINRFGNNINPFDDPQISRAFDVFVVGHFFVGRHVLDPQEENKRWEELCAFCRQEVNKANDELVQLLKTGSTKAMEKTKETEEKSSIFELKL
ncbi:MAG: hypothetical protein K2X02_02785 [Alphaproteobacteria bacterium]|nr:hypothetical protein [Alphaproteobacteria bacterium]